MVPHQRRTDAPHLPRFSLLCFALLPIVAAGALLLIPILPKAFGYPEATNLSPLTGNQEDDCHLPHFAPIDTGFISADDSNSRPEARTLPLLTRNEEEEEEEEGIGSAPEEEMASGEVGWRALVVGGTGAIGKYLVAELLSSDKFSAVTVIGRREIAFPSDRQPLPDQLAKLNYKNVADLAEIASIDPSQLTPSKYEAAFCTLGTTRKEAGSAENFRKIDHDAVNEFGNLAKRAGVQHLQLVTSGGANKNSYFLYMRTKGETEEHYRTLGVKQLSIFQPPLLDRGDKARTMEKLLAYVMPSFKVGDVAKAMVVQAVTVLQSNAEGEETLGWGMKKLIGK